MAVLVMLFLLGGTVHASNHVSGPTACAIELDDNGASDIAIPVAMITLIAVVRETIPTVMPALASPVSSPCTARTFRPPRPLIASSRD